MKIQVVLFSLFFAVLVALPVSVHAAATNIPPTCDPDFNDVLEARSWLSAKREVETAETLILKPDSVMEYTCFLPRISGHGNTVASTWLSTNFSGNYAAGTHGSGGTCIDMAVIWEFLKCRDWSTADFRTFTELQAADPRTGPACNEQNRADVWLANLDAAFPPPATPAVNGGMDALVPYMNMISWSGILSTQCGNYAPIPTGAVVSARALTRRGIRGTTFDEAVCPVPGCYYTGGVCAPSP